MYISLRANSHYQFYLNKRNQNKKDKKRMVGQWTKKISFFNIIIIVNMFVHYTQKKAINVY